MVLGTYQFFNQSNSGYAILDLNVLFRADVFWGAQPSIEGHDVKTHYPFHTLTVEFVDRDTERPLKLVAMRHHGATGSVSFV